MESSSREQLEAALSEALVCIEAAFGMLAPFYNEETLSKIKDAYMKSVESKLTGLPNAEEN